MLTTLIALELNDNDLTGTLPTELGLLTSLMFIRRVPINSLGGSLPPELGSLSHMRYAGLSHNQFTGTLPKEYGSCWVDVETVNLSENHRYIGDLNLYDVGVDNWGEAVVDSNDFTGLTGTLSEEYGAWTNVDYVNFSKNQLTGTLPASYGAWTKVTYVKFDHNDLTGTLPASYGQCSNIFWVGFVGTISMERCQTSIAIGARISFTILLETTTLCYPRSVGAFSRPGHNACLYCDC
jgi:Leucine-rich repeat (LRR) protein